MAGQISVSTIERKIQAKGTVDLYIGRGLTIIDANGGYQCVICLNSYWSTKVLGKAGDNIIDVSSTVNTGQTITVTNLTDNEVLLIYRRFVI